MSDLPNWVYDVVIELVRWSDEHPKLYTSTGGVEGYFRVDDCGCKALDHVPAEVRAHAEVMRGYLRNVTVVRDSPGDPPKCICDDLDASTPNFPLLTMRYPNPQCPVHYSGKP